MKYKVLNIIRNLTIGGLENQVLRFARFKNDYLENYLVITSKNIQSNLQNLIVIKRNFFIDPIFIYKIIKFIKKNNINIIHCHNFLECINVFIANKFLKKKIFLTIHGYKYFNKYFLKLSAKFILPKLSKIIFVSETLRNFYKSYFNEDFKNSVILYNGLPDINFNDMNSVLLRKLLNLKENFKILGTIGNFSSARNFYIIIKAFEILQKNNTNIALIIIGKEDYTNNSDYLKCLNYINKNNIKNVYLLGQLKEAYKLLNQFDIFVYSSKRETFCLSVAEAIATGLPVIVNDIPIFTEITENGKYAFLYPSENYIILAEKIQYVLDNLEEIKNIHRQNSLNFRNKFSFKNHINNFINLCNS